MSEGVCPFCAPAPERVFFTGERVVGLWDAHPVSPGHALLVTRRHVSAWFEASPEEQAELLRAIGVAKAVIETTRRPDGYNIGINVGEAAGQTVFHLHVHVIPRYTGDVPDPRGGVRHVIPAHANYLAAPRTPPLPEAPPPATQEPGDAMRAAAPPASASPAQPDDGRAGGALVRGGTADPLLPRLVALLDGVVATDIAVAFVLESGVRLLDEHLRDLLSRGGRVRIVTGDYLGVTEPSALLRLLDLQGDIQIRVFESGGTSFHPKAYILTHREGDGSAFVGSSNLTDTALRSGVEWNYRVMTTRDGAGFREVVDAFEELWAHPRTRPLDVEWVREYQARRPPHPLPAPVPPPAPVTAPHEVQRAALAALEATRQAGNVAGLVVLATGLGKTWLSAFDSDRPEFRRVLFIAHREEILTQAMRTFRAIRPTATLGFYTGAEKEPDAEVLFASIQTLGRTRHLHRFEPHRFDYVVVDEFHHAAAQTYRRVIGYLEPRFLLGLTATPERTDGGDLLSLCGDNLVYRCDLAEGIRRGLLSPFQYFGVPDEVDYANIPWRSSRFDEEALTEAVATRARAANALEQLRRHGGTRTLGFCVSQRHADFMAAFLRENGVRAVAVHAGEGSAPRAHSLERLEAGELDMVLAVDMFNEGVDLPNVDTVLMLRPSESRILWLQQFGRGLRFREGKTLRVIDYIGNHRVFLNKVRAILDIGVPDGEVSYDRQVALALEQLEAGSLELPPGCSVTYELEAKEILRALIRPTGQGDLLRSYYEEFRDLNGARPLAVEAFSDGYNPRATRRGGYGSWFDFVHAMGDLAPEHRRARERAGAFLQELEVTPMVRSYKMLVLLAMLDEGAFPGEIGIARLVERFGDLARKYAPLRQEVGEALEDPVALRRLIVDNPVRAWVGGAGTGGTSYFTFDGEVFSAPFPALPDELAEPFQDMARELAEWRLEEYLRRPRPSPGADRFHCRVSHAGDRPILFLPDRERNPGIPEGWTDVRIDGEPYQANFVKVALNVVVRPGTTENVLPSVLRRWLGPTAGHPGRSDAVTFERQGDAYVMEPAAGAVAERAGPRRWHRYSRAEAVEALNIRLTGWEQQAGVVHRPGGIVLFVTLDKGEMAAAYQYKDRFLSPTEFQWQSQNRTTQASERGQVIRRQREKATDVHLFVRRRQRERGVTQPFVYCGTLEFQRWQGERPITVWWRLDEPVPERLRRELEVPETG